MVPDFTEVVVAVDAYVVEEVKITSCLRKLVTGGCGNGNTVSRSNENDSNEITPGTNGETYPNIKCVACNFHRH